MTHRETHLEGFGLDKYTIDAFVAAGGFAEVYRARDTMLDIDVMVKVLKPSQADPRTVARFREEAMRTSKLHQPKHHPNVVEVFAVGESHGYHWLAMRLLHGETLESRLHRGPLPLPEASRVIGGVAAALDHAHSRKLIHRDVKPSNIFLTDDGGVVLMDFGLVREQHNPAGTATTSIIGTPQYMSPEQIKGEGLSHLSDIYSLGHVAFEVLTGRPAFPHEDGNTWRVLKAQVEEELPAMRLPDGSALPAGVEKAVRRAVRKGAGERWEVAGELAGELAGALDAAKVRPVEPASASSASATVDSRGQRVNERVDSDLRAAEPPPHPPVLPDLRTGIALFVLVGFSMFLILMLTTAIFEANGTRKLRMADAMPTETPLMPTFTPTADPAADPWHPVQDLDLADIPVPVAATRVAFAPATEDLDAAAEYAMDNLNEDALIEWYKEQMTAFGWGLDSEEDGSFVFLHTVDRSDRFADKGLKRTATLLLSGSSDEAEWTLIVEAPLAVPPDGLILPSPIDPTVTITPTRAISITTIVPGDGYFSQYVVLPASGNVDITIRQTSGICLAGGIPAVQTGRSSTGGSLFVTVNHGPESYGPSDEIGECTHKLTIAPKSAGNAEVKVSNVSGQTVDVELTIVGASAPR